MLDLIDKERDFIPPEIDGVPGSLPYEDLARLAEEGEYILTQKHGIKTQKIDPEDLERLNPVTEKLRKRALSVLKKRLPKSTRVSVGESWDYQGPPYMVRLYGSRGGNKGTLRG